MDSEKIKSLLAQLHQELSDAEELPPEVEGEVAGAVNEMAELLKAKPEVEEENHSAFEKLEEFALSFDVEHPKLASALRQISVALGNIGI